MSSWAVLVRTVNVYQSLSGPNAFNSPERLFYSKSNQNLLSFDLVRNRLTSDLGQNYKSMSTCTSFMWLFRVNGIVFVKIWNRKWGIFYTFNSQAVGMDSWVQSALKSILRGILFLNRQHDFSLLSSSSFLNPFLKTNSRKQKNHWHLKIDYFK